MNGKNIMMLKCVPFLFSSLPIISISRINISWHGSLFYRAIKILTNFSSTIDATIIQSFEILSRKFISTVMKARVNQSV